MHGGHFGRGQKTAAAVMPLKGCVGRAAVASHVNARLADRVPLDE